MKFNSTINNTRKYSRRSATVKQRTVSSHGSARADRGIGAKPWISFTKGQDLWQLFINNGRVLDEPQLSLLVPNPGGVKLSGNSQPTENIGRPMDHGGPLVNCYSFRPVESESDFVMKERMEFEGWYYPESSVPESTRKIVDRGEPDLDKERARENHVIYPVNVTYEEEADSAPQGCLDRPLDLLRHFSREIVLDTDLIQELSVQEFSNSEAIAAFIVSATDRCRNVKAPCAIKDIRLQTPVYPEVLDLLHNQRNEHKSLISVSLFFDCNFEIKSEYTSIWNVIVDLFRTIILFGYQIPSGEIRARMVKVWLSWSYKTSQLPAVKVVDGISFKPARWCKVVKYKLAAFAAYAKCKQGETIMPKNPLTVEDNPKIILDSKFSRWFDSLPEDTIAERMGRMSLIDSLCRGVKKGADRAGEDDCILNQLETFQLFTIKRDLPMNVVEVSPGNHLMIEPRMIYDQLERSVHELFEGATPFEMSYGHSPSFSSSTETSRRKGGQMAEVRNIPQFQRRKQTDLKIQEQNALLCDPVPVLYANETGEYDPVCRKAMPSSDPEYLGVKQSGECLATKVLEFSQPDCLGTDLDLDELCQICLLGESDIRLIALLEALKVRGISTPNGLETWLLKPLQKYISHQMRRFNVFKVTTTPLTEEIVKKALPSMGIDETIISGDYDNATNMILSTYTEKVIQTICQDLDLPPSYANLAIRSLVGNLVFFDIPMKKTKLGRNGKEKVSYDKKSYKGQQVEAQPMGKVLSFVVLCLINFTVCRFAKELDTGKQISMKKFRGLINGDDVFFTLKNWKLWESCSSMVGLVNSIGKTFLSKVGDRCMIEMNSRTIIVDSSNPRDLRFFMVPFINFGLMKGLIRSENKADSTVISQMAVVISKMSSCHTELVTGFDVRYKELDYLFKGYHQEYLQHDLLSGVPYYIPKWLGGLGLDPGPDFVEQIPLLHRKAASVIFSDYDDFKKRPQQISDVKTCLIDDIITKSVRSELELRGIPAEVTFRTIEDERGLRRDLKEENILIYNKLVEQVWRTEWEVAFFEKRDNKKAELLFQDRAEKALIKKLRSNSKLWRNAHSKALNDKNVSPLPYHKLWHRKFDSYWPALLVDGSYLNDRDNQRKILEHQAIRPRREVTVRDRDNVALPNEILDLISYYAREVRNAPPTREEWLNDNTCFQKYITSVDPHGFSTTRLISKDLLQYKNPYLNGSLKYFGSGSGV